MVSVLSFTLSGLGSTLTGDIVLCFWARHLSLTVPLSTQVVKLIPVNLLLGDNWDKRWPDRLLG